MKNYKLLNLLLIVNLCCFCYQTNAQNSNSKNSKTEEKQVADFADDFIKIYYDTFDLTKISASYFVNDYKKRNNLSFFINQFDKELNDEEKFQNYFMLMDLLQIGILEGLKEAEFDLEKMYKNLEKNSENDLPFPKSILSSIKKYPKAESFLLKENFSKVKNVRDFREAIQDFHLILQELRASISAEVKIKYLATLQKNKEHFFKFGYEFNCTKQENFCDGFPYKTKMYFFRAIPFDLLITNLEGKFKIVQVMPVSD